MTAQGPGTSPAIPDRAKAATCQDTPVRWSEPSPPRPHSPTGCKAQSSGLELQGWGGAGLCHPCVVAWSSPFLPRRDSGSGWTGHSPIPNYLLSGAGSGWAGERCPVFLPRPEVSPRLQGCPVHPISLGKDKGLVGSGPFPFGDQLVSPLQVCQSLVGGQSWRGPR